VIGHLGPRVSALLDGQLSPADEERAWEHVHSCHQCRDAVEREGWVKTRLATMQLAGAPAPSHLKGSLLVRGLIADWPPVLDGGADQQAVAGSSGSRRHLGLAGISSGAVGAAVMGVLALGASPANAPGAMTRPTPESFGSNLVSAVTAVIERDLRIGSRLGEARPGGHEPRRTLAP
jgi:anti-sigma factor RsiW